MQIKENEIRNEIRKVEIQNRKRYLELLKEAKKSNPIAIPKKSEKIEILDKPALLQEEKEENFVSFYKNLLKDCPSINELPHYLPKKESASFSTTLNLLIIELLKDAKEIERKLFQKQNQNLIHELEEQYRLIEWLINYRDEEKEVSLEEEQISKKKNTLIYLTSSSGNCYALEDCKKIDNAYAPSFLSLLKSIQNGNFKNLKIFYNNGKLNGILEVKGNKTRILFQRITKDKYIILSMFMKTEDVSHYYHESLYQRVLKYRNSYDWICENIEKEEYLRKNEEYTLELERRLKNGRIDQATSNGNGRKI